MKINTNTISAVTQNYLRKSNLSLENAMERLSSGKRINSAADDAAGLAIAARMETKVRGMDVAVRNTNDGISLVQTAEAGLGSISSILQRMRELAVQSVNGTNTATDRTSLNTEYSLLKGEIDHIASNTTFNGVNLLNTASTINIQLSDVKADVMGITTIEAGSAKLNAAAKGAGVGLASKIDTDVDATLALEELDASISEVSDMRAKYGASLNRLNFNVDNITSMRNNLGEARSRIEDADMAREVSEMTKHKILTQSGVSMLTQANQNPQMITQLLQN